MYLKFYIQFLFIFILNYIYNNYILKIQKIKIIYIKILMSLNNINTKIYH